MPKNDYEQGWRDGFREGQRRARLKYFEPGCVQGHCFPQGHTCVTTTSSGAPAG